MPKLKTKINVNEIDEEQGLVLLPAGRYSAIITETEMVEAKESGIEYLKLTLTITDGEFEGCVLFERLNILHDSEMTKDIAIKRLASYGRACRVFVIKDTDDLLGTDFDIEVSVRQPAKGSAYGPENRITKVYYDAPEDEEEEEEEEEEEKPSKKASSKKSKKTEKASSKKSKKVEVEEEEEEDEDEEEEEEAPKKKQKKSSKKVVKKKSKKVVEDDDKEEDDEDDDLDDDDFDF